MTKSAGNCLFCLVTTAKMLGMALAAPLGSQIVLGGSDFDVLRHLSGITPPIALGNPASPDACHVESAAYITRHSSIWVNDEEYPVTIEPFIDKLARMPVDAEAHPPLHFLPSWTSPITEDDLEMLTRPGASDAEKFGTAFSRLYRHLMPTASDRFLVWAADTPRDVETAQAFIRGAMPEHDKNGDGEGDDHVDLVRVPKKDPDWKESLTPHKACPRFSKEYGQAERDTWKNIYIPPIARRFDGLMPGFNFSIEDVYGMQQLCGYETVIRGSQSPMCDPFTEQEIRSFEYAEDLRYHYMVGYGADYSPALGLPFLRTAVARLLNSSIETHASGGYPKLPPNDTSTNQKLFVWFSHREELPLIATALGLFNNTQIWPKIGINQTMPVDHIPSRRLWQTSAILPFLGHIALERMRCADDQIYVRVIVNGSPMALPACHDGPGSSCQEEDFKAFMRSQEAQHGNFEQACGIDRGHV